MARKVLLATHGHLADGLMSAARVLVGDSYPIETINAYTDEEPDDYTERIRSFVNGVGPEDEGVICTDLTGGSVNQKVVRLLAEMGDSVPKTFYVVSETNLMTLLALLLEGRALTDEVMGELVGQSVPSVIAFRIVENSEEPDEDFLS